jgi:uncharacterized membrane protein YgdD (TMEM256/DUF423 family)
MKMERQFVVLGAIFALFGVLAGAFGAHALKETIGPDRLEVFKTGAQYQMIHALALFAVAFVATRWPGGLVNAAGWLFVAGIVLFSGSLYLYAVTDQRLFGAITPLGGLAFIAGWICLALGVLRSPAA